MKRFIAELGSNERYVVPLAVLTTLLVVSGCAHFHDKPLWPDESLADFEGRSLDDPGLRAFAQTNWQQVVPVWPPAEWGINALTCVAFYYQPALAEARAQWAVAKAGRITAGGRPNPSVTFSPEYDTTTPPPWILGASLDVPIETAGKRGRRMEQAQHLAEAARWHIAGIAWQARSSVRAGLLDLYVARETETLLSRQTSAESNVVRLLEGQLQAGNVSEFEVTQARIAFAKTQLALQDALRQKIEALGKLADALGLPVRALDGVQFSFDGFSGFPAALTAPEVRRQAVLNRADIREALAEYAASQSALQLEIAKQYPDVHLSPGYQLDQTDNKWSLGLTVTLPILNQNQGPIAEAEAKREQSAAHFLSVQAAAIGEIDRALASYQSALRQSDTASALLQNSQKRLDSVRAMEHAGELDPLAVANARMEYNTGALARLGVLVKAQQALGQLEDAVQSPLALPPAVLDTAEQNPKSQ